MSNQYQLTRREKLAQSAMAAILSNTGFRPRNSDDVNGAVETAYKIADKMLAETPMSKNYVSQVHEVKKREDDRDDGGPKRHLVDVYTTGGAYLMDFYYLSKESRQLLIDTLLATAPGGFEPKGLPSAGKKSPVEYVALMENVYSGESKWRASEDKDEVCLALSKWHSEHGDNADYKVSLHELGPDLDYRISAKDVEVTIGEDD